jgi:DHA2 family multidrug resistance protein
MESFPPEKQGMALGVFAMGVVVAPVIGPTLGGYLTDAISWRWAFYINIPIGILALILQNKLIEDPPYIKQANPGALDKIRFGLLAIWCASLQFLCDKGQEEDWFGSLKIRWALVLFLLGFALFLARELTAEKPLLNLRVLGDRNFGGGCFLIFVFGSCVYAIATMLPLFYQTVMGYNATTAGLAVSPRGLGAIFGSLFAGRLVAKVDPRLLLAFAFAVLCAASLWNGGLTLDMAPTSLLWPIVITGFAFPVIFVPLSGVAMGKLRQEEIGNASGLYNLLRNLGGSIGIAIATTLTQRHLQSHRNEIVHSISGSSLILRQQLIRLTALMRLHAGPVKASLRSYALLERRLNQQAQVWAYIDVFRYIAVVCALCVPFVFILKRAHHSGAAE